MTFSLIVTALCMLTSVACCALLARGYLRTRNKLLFWSALCFGGLALNNLLLFLDLGIFGLHTGLHAARTLTMVISLGVLLFGFIWKAEE